MLPPVLGDHIFYGQKGGLSRQVCTYNTGHLHESNKSYLGYLGTFYT